MSFAINYALSGYNVLGYHVFNLLVHALKPSSLTLVTVTGINAGTPDTWTVTRGPNAQPIQVGYHLDQYTSTDSEYVAPLFNDRP